MPYPGAKTLSGWGVARLEPWHFVGLFPSQVEAEAKAAELGPGYVAKFGENEEGTDNFVWSTITTDPNFDR